MDQQNPQQPAVQQNPPIAQIQPPIQQPPPERKPFFNIKQQPPPEQPIQQPIEPEPEEKKGGWKKWVITISVIIIAAGLGYYFLFR